MPGQLRCRICGTRHKATPENFPLALYGNVEVYEGKGKNRKRIAPDRRGIIGYACKQCVKKGHRENFIKEHKIKPKPGERIDDAITKKIDELKLQKTARAPQKKQPAPVQPKGLKGLFKGFFKRKGRQGHE